MSGAILDVEPFALLYGILSLAVLLLLVVLIALTASRHSSHQPRSDALRVLEERYARGEIDRDEFLDRRAVLEGRTP
jgi:putative membrane protein